MQAKGNQLHGGPNHSGIAHVIYTFDADPKMGSLQPPSCGAGQVFDLLSCITCYVFWGSRVVRACRQYYDYCTPPGQALSYGSNYFLTRKLTLNPWPLAECQTSGRPILCGTQQTALKNCKPVCASKIVITTVQPVQLRTCCRSAMLQMYKPVYDDVVISLSRNL